MRAASVIALALAACHSSSSGVRDGSVPDAPTDATAAADAGPDGGVCASVFPNGDPCDSPEVGAPGLGSSTIVCTVPAAYADGTDHTAGIQAVINSCTNGKVVVPAGTYHTGTLLLASNMIFHLDAGATLYGEIPTSLTNDLTIYPTPDPTPDPNNTNSKNAVRALVLANGATNLTIEADAGGTILGNGDANFFKKDGAAGAVDAGLMDFDRPIALWIANSSNVTVSGIKIAHSAMWSFVNMEDTNLRISNVTVDSPDPNERDGLDIIDSHHVCIENSSISSEDDSICMKSGSLTGVDDVHVKASTAHGHNGSGTTGSEGNGLKLGTASYGGFTHICYDDITVSNYKQAAMAVESVDGATIAGVLFTGITFSNVESPFFVLLGYRVPARDTPRVGSIDGVRFEHVTGSGVTSGWGSIITGTDTGRNNDAGIATDAGVLEIHNVAFDDITLALPAQDGGVASSPIEYYEEYPAPDVFGALPAWAFYVRHATGVMFTDVNATVTPSTDPRPETVTVP